MKKLLKYFIPLAATLYAGFSIAHAATCFPNQGCTGTAVIPKPGQVLIGNSSSVYTPAYLTPGSNITIATSSGGITITAAGGGDPTINGITTSSFVFAASGPGLTVASSGFTITYTYSSSSLNLGNFLTTSTRGTVTTSSAVTANQFPFWVSDGGLSGTSTISTSGGVITISTSTLFSSNIGVALQGRFGGAGGLYNYAVGSGNGSLGFNVDSGYLAGVNGLGGMFQLQAADGELVYYTTDSVTAGNIFTFTRALTIAPGVFSVSSTNSFFQGSSTFRSGVKVFGNLIDAGGIKYSTSTGGGTPAGSNGDVQINANGAFGVDAGGFFHYSTSTHRLSISNVTSSLFIGSNLNFATSTVTSTVTNTYKFTGATSSFTVPAGTTSLIIQVSGGRGGNKAGGTQSQGGSASGTLAVSPGQVYYFCVGGEGTTSSVATTFCGGGAGGVANSAGGGGGATWFGTSGQGSADGAFATSTASTTIIIVAGGGGGSANGAGGGNGGGLTGATGGTQGACAAGTGGSQTAGGSLRGAGAQGGSGTVSGSDPGGGGGGGWMGGGGGDASGGVCASDGGGGSSFTTSTLTATSTTLGGSTTSSLKITYTSEITTVFNTSTSALYVGGHITTGLQNQAVPTVSTCGTLPTIQGNDTAGIVSVGSGIVVACTVTFGKAYANIPVCTLGLFSAAVTGGFSEISTTAFTTQFSATLGSGKFNYICLDHD